MLKFINLNLYKITHNPPPSAILLTWRATRPAAAVRPRRGKVGGHAARMSPPFHVRGETVRFSPTYEKKDNHKTQPNMAHIYELTPDDMTQIVAFLDEGDTTAAENGVLDRLFKLSMTASRKLVEVNASAAKKNFSLERRLDRYRKREEAAIAEGNFDETGLDSLDVALALLHCLQRVKTYNLTKNMLIYILYEMYASWLASKKQRLFAEHPVVTEWGPQLWRVYKHIANVKAPVPYDCFSKLANQNPAVAAFCRNACNKYYDWKASDLKDIFLKSAPYKSGLPQHNNGKWGKEISDSDIYVWKTEKK